MAVQVIKELQLETLERQCNVARENCYAAATLFYTRKPQSLEKMYRHTAKLCKKLNKQKIVEEPCDTFVSITSERPGSRAGTAESIKMVWVGHYSRTY